MADKYTNADLREIVAQEGLDYTFHDYLSPSNIIDAKVQRAAYSFLLARQDLAEALEINGE